MPQRENQPKEPIDASKCLANDLGRMKMGVASGEEIDELIEKRISVGKRGRSKYGRLVCEFASCEATCNVETKDGMLVEKNMRQAFALDESCAILKYLVADTNDPEFWSTVPELS